MDLGYEFKYNISGSKQELYYFHPILKQFYKKTDNSFEKLQHQTLPFSVISNDLLQDDALRLLLNLALFYTNPCTI